MKSEFFLTRKYIAAHKRQYVGLVLACSLFIAAFITTLIYRQSFLVTAIDNNDKTFGEFKGIVYNAEPDKIAQYRTEIESGGSGIMRVTGLVNANTNGQKIYIGSMDSSAIRLRRLELKEGRYAAAANEIAVEDNALSVLFPEAKCGDALEISITKDGAAHTGKYLLVGIIDDYVSNWQRTDASKKSIEYPPPAILTADDGTTAVYTHVLCADPALETLLGGQYALNAHNHRDPSLVSQKNAVNIFVTAILSFFVIVMVFGIISNISYIMKGQKEYLTLLRCIGMTKRRGVMLFLLQAALLLFASCAIGALIGSGLGLTIVEVSEALGRHLIFAVSFSCFWPAFLVSAIAIFGAYFFPVERFFKEMPLETGSERLLPPKTGNEKTQSLKKLWLRAAARENRWQNAIAVMLIAACLFITVSGGLIALFAPWEEYGGVDSIDKDYILYVPGGTQAAENYYMTIPRKTGVSQADLDLLRETQGLEVRSAVVNNMTSHFVLYSPEAKTPYFDRLVSENRVLEKKNIPNLPEVIAGLGGKDGDLLVKPRLTGLDYQTAVNSVRIVDGAINKEDFISGNLIIAPNTFSVGDSFLLVTPILANESALKDSAERFDFVTKTVTVAAVYDKAEDSRLFYSAEAIMAADDSARYEEIDLVNLVKNDASASAQIEKTLNQITARSSFTDLDNFIDKRQEYIQEVHNGQVLTGMLVAIFVIIVTLATTYSVKIKLRTALRSYMLMRAIGADGNTVTGLITSDILRLIAKGSAIGIALGYLIPVLRICRIYHDINLTAFLLWPGLAAIAVFVVMTCLGIAATRSPVKRLLTEDIASALDSVEL